MTSHDESLFSRLFRSRRLYGDDDIYFNTENSLNPSPPLSRISEVSSQNEPDSSDIPSGSNDLTVVMVQPLEGSDTMENIRTANVVEDNRDRSDRCIQRSLGSLMCTLVFPVFLMFIVTSSYMVFFYSV